jgi:NAD(P)H-nitrite reductase large subunit
LAYFLRGDIPETQLQIRRPDDLQRLRLQRIHTRVEALDPARSLLRFGNGDLVQYQRLLLATGALAVHPNFPGHELAGIVKLDSLDDTQRIIEQARRRKPGIVIGGGITALELVEGLHARGMQVHFFLRGTGFWTDVLDEQESAVVLKRLQHEGVQIHLKTQIKQAHGSNGKLRAVETAAGQTIPCEMLGVAIGVKPRIELAAQAGLAVQRGVLVDSYLRSSVPNIFVAGDCAEVQNPRTGTTTLDVLWPIALRQGRIAGANMAGQALEYVKEIAFNVTQIAGLKTTIIGSIGGGTNQDLVAITRGESESWRWLPGALTVSNNQDEINRVRLVIGERTILGALVMGDQRWSRPLQDLILNEINIAPIRGSLVSGGATALQRLAEFHTNWLRRTRG